MVSAMSCKPMAFGLNGFSLTQKQAILFSLANRRYLRRGKEKKDSCHVLLLLFSYPGQVKCNVPLRSGTFGVKKMLFFPISLRLIFCFFPPLTVLTLCNIKSGYPGSRFARGFS